MGKSKKGNNNKPITDDKMANADLPVTPDSVKQNGMEVGRDTERKCATPSCKHPGVVCRNGRYYCKPICPTAHPERSPSGMADKSLSSVNDTPTEAKKKRQAEGNITPPTGYSTKDRERTTVATLKDANEMESLREENRMLKAELIPAKQELTSLHERYADLEG